MNNREIVEELKAAGFVLFKNGSKHQFWKKGRHIVPVSYGTKCNPRNAASVRSILRRIKEEESRHKTL